MTGLPGEKSPGHHHCSYERPEILEEQAGSTSPAENIRKALESPGVVIAGSGSETWEKIRGLSRRHTQRQLPKPGSSHRSGRFQKISGKSTGKNEPVIRENTTHILILAGASALGRLWIKSATGWNMRRRSLVQKTGPLPGRHWASYWKKAMWNL